jgi:serine/threonine protein kinase
VRGFEVGYAAGVGSGTTLEEDRKVLAAAGGGEEQPTRQSMASQPGSEHMAEVASSVREGDVLADRYRVIQRIGKGGMGEVYLAEHVAIGRQVAIKILLGNLQEKPDLAKRFLQEARTASKLRHPNVVDIIDFGHVDPRTPFFVMEYLVGQDLKGVVKAEKQVPWPRAREIGLQICAGLAVAHSQGFIHRDLKPDNVYLIRDEMGREHVKILDFGIAKIISDEAHDATQTGVLLGTPEYMSPEQAEDKVLDARSDIYALGVILYRMLVGRVPFQSKAFMTVLAKHIQEKPMPPREAAPEAGITAAQEAVILKCLAKAPEDRYQSADAVAAALRAADAVEVARPAAGGRTGLYATIGVMVVAAIVVALALTNRTPPEPEPTPEPVKTEPTVVAPPVVVEPPPVVKDPPVVVDPPPVVVDPPPVVQDPPPTKGKTPKPKPGKADTKPRDALSAADLRAGFKSAIAAVHACQSQGGIAGTTVKVDVTIGPAGQVESATAHKPALGSPLGRCVEKAAKTGKFPPLTKQLKITYPFQL